LPRSARQDNRRCENDTRRAVAAIRAVIRLRARARLPYNDASARALSTPTDMNLPLRSLRAMRSRIAGGLHSGDVGIAAAR
jgi:hypothetical protein